MSPKEKAEDLFTTYRFALSIPNAPLGEYKDQIAKQCALIVVDEIIQCLNDDDLYIQGESNINDFISYYKEVKQEIEKL
jgi:hypothetical protein